MGPRLVSLALLLLALCSHATSIHIKITKVESTSQQMSFMTNLVPPAKKAEVEARTSDLLLILAAFGAVMPEKSSDDDDNPKVRKILDTAVHCALTSGLLKEPKALKTLFYGAGDRSPLEDGIAAKIGITCPTTSTAEESTCFCGESKNTIFYCVVLKYKATMSKNPEGKCKDAAIADLKAAAPTLYKYFDFDAMAKSDKSPLGAVFKHKEGSIDAILKTLDEEITKFYCDAIKPETDAAIKGLLKSDVSFGFIEEIVTNVLFDKQSAAAVDYSCENDKTWRATPFGECVCAEDRGFTFCVYKALGLFFQGIEFLDCKADVKKFIPEKKPTESKLPQFVPPSSPAAASSLLLAPASIAAAILLLRH